jgi:hypothetical protein
MRVASRFPFGPAGMALVLVALVAALSAPARAEGEPPKGGDEKEARRLFQQAELSFNVGKFAEALTDYQAAYEAKPLPGFLFNIAQCYRNMGDYERARFFFRRYMTLEPRSPNRRRVEALIDEMSRKLDEKAAAAPVAPPSPTAEADARPPTEAPVSSPPPVEAQPVPVAPAPPALETPAPSIVVVAEPPPAHPVWKRWWFWTGVGAVVAGGAVAAFFLTRPEIRAPGTLEPIDGR